MKKKELTELMAEQAHLAPAEAADELDNAIHGVLKNMRKHGPSRPNALQRLINEADCAPDGKGKRATS